MEVCVTKSLLHTLVKRKTLPFTFGKYTEKLLKLLNSTNISVVLIPPNCTDQLQPLDLSVNKASNKFLQKIQNWYDTQVCTQLDGKLEKEAIDL